MSVHADELSVREARERYFEANGLAASAYQDPWVRLRVGPIPIAFPNTASRKRAVPYHDLHHVATGYATDLAGEGEIGAWELATGCTRVRAALVLNLLAVWVALLFAPVRVYRAFVRGRHSRNLYARPWDDGLLAQPVGALRRELALDAPSRPATGSDKLAFAAWMAAVVGLQLAIASVLFGIPAWLLGAFG